jgi:hypothetical protein
LVSDGTEVIMGLRLAMLRMHPLPPVTAVS